MMGTASGEETAAMTPELNEGDFGRTAVTPSGKGAGDENFPVGSWLLPARLRPPRTRVDPGPSRSQVGSDLKGQAAYIGPAELDRVLSAVVIQT